MLLYNKRVMYSSRILRPGMYTIDQENKVVVDIVVPPPEAIIPGTGDEAADDNMAPGGSEHHKVTAEEQSKYLVSQAKAQGEQIVQDAIVEASAKRADILHKAGIEAEKLYENAKAQGYKDGMDSCQAEGNAIRAEANALKEQAIADRKHAEDTLEPEIFDIIMGVVDKLIGTSVAINPAIVVNLIKQGLASATITGDVIVYVSPQDLEHVQAHKDELLALTDGSVKLEVVKDLSLNPTDCVIETPFGSIDSSLGQQYEQLRADLTYIFNNR